MSGSINFDNLDLTQASDAVLRSVRGVRVAYVAQSAAAALNPAHRLIDQFAEVVVQHGKMTVAEAKVRGRELYRRLELPDPDRIGERYPHEVSGGQLQRAMIAMAMACKPDLIVFDEPTTALDVTTQIEVLAAIKDAIRALHSAAIYISHDLALVAQIADRVMVLRHGRIVEEGPVRQVLEAPQQDYTRALISVRKVRGSTVAHEQADRHLLEVQGVSAAYGSGVRVLEDVNLTIGKGETVAVVGEFGSGKSTLARVITGLLVPLTGRILFQGDVVPPSFKQRQRDLLRRVQMIYQMPDVALNPRQKVRETIGRPLAFYFGMTGRELQQRIEQLLHIIELDARYCRPFPV